MIENKLILEDFNKKYVKQKHYSYAQKLEIYEDLLKEARHLKKMPLENHLEGIEACLRIASIVNSLK